MQAIKLYKRVMQLAGSDTIVLVYTRAPASVDMVHALRGGWRRKKMAIKLWGQEAVDAARTIPPPSSKEMIENAKRIQAATINAGINNGNSSNSGELQTNLDGANPA